MPASSMPWVLVQGDEKTGIRKRVDGKYVVTYEGREVGLWTKKRWARRSLKGAIRTKGASNW